MNHGDKPVPVIPVSINSLINGKTTLKIIADFYKNK